MGYLSIPFDSKQPPGLQSYPIERRCQKVQSRSLQIQSGRSLDSSKNNISKNDSACSIMIVGPTRGILIRSQRFKEGVCQPGPNVTPSPPPKKKHIKKTVYHAIRGYEWIVVFSLIGHRLNTPPPKKKKTIPNLKALDLFALDLDDDHDEALEKLVHFWHWSPEEKDLREQPKCPLFGCLALITEGEKNIRKHQTVRTSSCILPRRLFDNRMSNMVYVPRQDYVPIL